MQELALAGAGQLRLRRRPTAIGEIAERTLAALPAVAAGGPALRLELPVDLPLVDADPERVGHVLVKITVCDTGTGIAPTRREHARLAAPEQLSPSPCPALSQRPRNKPVRLAWQANQKDHLCAAWPWRTPTPEWARRGGLAGFAGTAEFCDLPLDGL